MSEGISNEERLEIEHYGLYVASLDMPSQPSMEEVATMFPTSFSFFRLRTVDSELPGPNMLEKITPGVSATILSTH